MSDIGGFAAPPGGRNAGTATRRAAETSLRERIAAALKGAVEAGDRRRASTLRLIATAVRDRDNASRDRGCDGIGDPEVRLLLLTMIRQREESARSYEEGARLDLAEEERREIEVVREFLPPQLDEGAMRTACQEVVAELGAHGLRDVGRTMARLRERYPDRMDFGQASGVVKDLLCCDR